MCLVCLALCGILLVDEVSFCVGGLGLCTKTGVQPTNHAQLNY